MNNVYRDADHTYWMDGVRVLNPSWIFDLMGLNEAVKKYATDAHRDKGSLIHLGYLHLAHNDVAWDWWEKEHPQLVGHLRSMEKAIKELDFIPDPDLCEKPQFHETLKYGVTPDMPGIFRAKNQRGVLEGKSGQMPKTASIQTAFQNMAIWPSDYLTTRRVGVKTNENGIPKITEFTNPGDYYTAVNMTGACYWKLANGYN